MNPSMSTRRHNPWKIAIIVIIVLIVSLLAWTKLYQSQRLHQSGERVKSAARVITGTFDASNFESACKSRGPGIYASYSCLSDYDISKFSPSLVPTYKAAIRQHFTSAEGYTDCPEYPGGTIPDICVHKDDLSISIFTFNDYSGDVNRPVKISSLNISERFPIFPFSGDTSY